MKSLKLNAQLQAPYFKLPDQKNVDQKHICHQLSMDA